MSIIQGQEFIQYQQVPQFQQTDQQDPFCAKHDDYIIQLVCLDYSNEESYKMCKKCKKELWAQNEQNLEQKFQNLQQAFEKDFFNLDADKLEGLIKTKLTQYCDQLSQSLMKELQKIPDQFMKAVTFLKGLPLNSNMDENLQTEKQRYFNEYQIIKQNVTDIIINQMDLAEQHLFPHDNPINQTLYELPDNLKILTNVDGYNLLRKFEQLYIHKFKMYNEDDLAQHRERKLREVRSLKYNQQKLIDNSDKIIKQVEKEIDQQKACMLARLTNYQKTYKNNVYKLDQFLTKWENFQTDKYQIEIQDLKENYLQNIVKFDQLEDYLERQAKEQAALQSRICHLGKLDIKISLEQIQKSLCINFIPILINTQSHEALIGQIEYNMPPVKDAIQISGGSYDQKGSYFGDSNIQLSSGKKAIGRILDDKIQGNIVIKHTKESLFQLDLSQYLHTNEFDYNKIVGEDQREEYIEVKNLWRCCQSNADINDKTYTLTITQQQQGSLIFKDIKLNNNQLIDQTHIVTIESQATGSQISQYGKKQLYYIGTLNNKLRYHGQGILTIGNIIRKGQWQNGLLEGQGEICRKLQDESEKVMYKGEFQKGKQHGKGTQYYPDDYQYDGEFVNGLREGKGTISKKTQNGLQVIEKTEWKQDFPASDKCSIF